MTASPRSSPRSFVLGSLAALAACAGPSWTAEERQEFAAMQKAVKARLSESPEALLTNAVVILPNGRDVDSVDDHLNVLPTVPAGAKVQYATYGPQSKSQLPSAVIRGDKEATVVAAGLTLTGFDSVDDLVIGGQSGVVLLATRHGEQALATPDRTWSGRIWRPDLKPQLSTDGSHFVFVKEGSLNDTSMIAPTSAPHRCTPLDFGCTVHWPVWPGRDGSRVRAIVEDKGHIEVRDNGKIIALAEDYQHAFYDAERDQLRVYLTTGGKVSILIGERLTPSLDSYRALELSTDGQHYAAIGREGNVECLVVDGNQVLRHEKIVAMALSADGTAWAAAVQEGEQGFVVRASGRTGPMPTVAQLVLAPDGNSLAVGTVRDGKTTWSIDGVPLAGFDDAHHLLLLPNRLGAVFAGHDAGGWWIVAGSQKDGPWDRVERCRVLADGKHVLGLAQREREAHRRILVLP